MSITLPTLICSLPFCLNLRTKWFECSYLPTPLTGAQVHHQEHSKRWFSASVFRYFLCIENDTVSFYSSVQHICLWRWFIVCVCCTSSEALESSPFHAASSQITYLVCVHVLCYFCRIRRDDCSYLPSSLTGAQVYNRASAFLALSL